MTFIRGQERLAFDTTRDYLVAQLTTLGWFGSVLPFGAANAGPVVLLDYVPDNLSGIAPNTIAFTNGTDQEDKEAEMGADLGGLWETDYVFFIDIWAESQGIAKQLASDVRAILTGRLAGCSRVQQVIDKTVVPSAPAAGHFLQYEHVETETPASQSQKLGWRVVKVTAEHYYNATGVGAM